MSKFTEFSNRGFVISRGSIFFRRKRPKPLALTTWPNKGYPSVFCGFPMHSFETALTITAYFSILAVLAIRSFSQIITAIVKRVAIGMIAFFAWATSENQPMHADVTMTPSIKSLSTRVPSSVPVPLRQPFKIIGVNDGVLPLRKWNQSERFYDWLSNGMPLNPVFRHESSFKGLMYSAILADFTLSCEQQ